MQTSLGAQFDPSQELLTAKKDHHALLCSCKFKKSRGLETEQKMVFLQSR